MMSAARLALLVGLFLLPLLPLTGCPRKGAPPKAENGGTAAARVPSAQPGQGDQLSPALVATAKGFVVGWQEDLGDRARLMVRAAGTTPTTKSYELAAGPDVSALRLAAAGDKVIAVWSAGGRVWLRPLGSDGAPRAAARVLSGKGKAGPPDVLLLQKKRLSFGVAFTEGGRVHALQVDGEGQELARTSWFGGNLRPSRIRLPKGAAPPPAERAKPLPLRPTLWWQAGKLQVRWHGGHWHSDDLAGSLLYRHAVRWQDDDKQEPQPLTRGRVWDAGLALAVGSDGVLRTIVAYHNPNGGPWQLRLQREDAKDAAQPFTSETAGPLSPALLATPTSLVAGWTSPARGGIALARFDAAGKPTIRVLASQAAPGEAGLALASRGEDVRVAYVQRARGLCRVEVTALPTAGPEAIAPAATTVRGKALAATRAIYADPTIARFDDGRFVVLAGIKKSDKPTLRGLFFDAAGQLEPKLQALSEGLPRLDYPTTARLGKHALFAFVACGGSSICSPSVVRVGVLGATGVVQAARGVTPAQATLGQPALAVDGERVALVVKESYGGFQLRRARAKTAVAAVDALEKAKALPIYIVDSNYAGAPALAFTQGGLVLIQRDKRGDHEITRVLFIADGSDKVEERADLPAVSYGAWGAHRLLAVKGGAALIGVRVRGHRVDTVLRFLDATGKVRGTTVLGRRMVPGSPMLRADGRGGVVAAWYDRRTDGYYLAHVDGQGRRRLGPLRLDDPALRSSFGVPLIAAARDAGQWHALWADPYTGHYALYQARVSVP